jgi:hypothetical protein
MNCPRCSELVEPGAAFCGNCGQAVRGLPAPGYELADKSRFRAEKRTMVGLLIAVLAIPGALIPALGVAMAVIGLVLATTSRAVPKKLMSNVAICIAGLAILLSAGMFAYRIDQAEKTKKAAEASQAAEDEADIAVQAIEPIVGGVLDTPCYKLKVPSLKNVEQDGDSCNLRAYSGADLASSSEFLTIDTAWREGTTDAAFMEVAKQSATASLADNLKDFTVTSQGPGSFAGSPAYILDAKDDAGSTVRLAMVSHQVTHGENVIVLVHGLEKGQADLSAVEQSWQWK